MVAGRREQRDESPPVLRERSGADLEIGCRGPSAEGLNVDFVYADFSRGRDLDLYLHKLSKQRY